MEKRPGDGAFFWPLQGFFHEQVALCRDETAALVDVLRTWIVVTHLERDAATAERACACLDTGQQCGGDAMATPLWQDGDIVDVQQWSCTKGRIADEAGREADCLPFVFGEQALYRRMPRQVACET